MFGFPVLHYDDPTLDAAPAADPRWAFLAGAVAGAAAVVLWAPAKGADVRRWLGSTARAVHRRSSHVLEAARRLAAAQRPRLEAFVQRS